MNKKIGLIIAGVIVVLLIVTGFVVYKAVFSGSPAPSGPTTEAITPIELPAADASIQVDLTKSKATANAVVISVKGMGNKIISIGYELQYTSNGVVKGVQSGVKPLDVSNQDTLSREIYLGTCSKNVCTPDTGVSKLTLNLVFTDTSGKQSQFSKDYTL